MHLHCGNANLKKKYTIISSVIFDKLRQHQKSEVAETKIANLSDRKKKRQEIVEFGKGSTHTKRTRSSLMMSNQSNVPIEKRIVPLKESHRDNTYSDSEL